MTISRPETAAVLGRFIFIASTVMNRVYLPYDGLHVSEGSDIWTSETQHVSMQELFWIKT